MTKLMHAIAAVIVCVMIGGVLGGVAGRAVGRLSPSFVEALYPIPPDKPRPPIDPTEFGLGLGIVSGLFFGAGTGLLLTTVHAARDAWVLRGRALKS